MDRYGYPSNKTSLYSDSFDYDKEKNIDRYGFGDSCLVPNEDNYLPEHKPHFKITVSSTGKVDEKILPPIESNNIFTTLDYPTKNHPNPSSSKVITLTDLAKAFNSPWLREHKFLGEALLHALHEDPYPTKKPLTSNYSRSQPYFLGCHPDSRNTTTFNGHNIHISMYITDENSTNKSFMVIPFGDNHYDLPQSGVIFKMYHPKDDEYIGSIHGQLISQDYKTVIRLVRIEDFARNQLNWSDLPIGTNLIATFNIEGSIPLPIQDHEEESGDEESGEEEQLLETIDPKQPELSPTFHQDGDHVEIYLKINGELPSSFQIPLKDHQVDLQLNVVDTTHQPLAYINARLGVDGVIHLMDLKSLDGTSCPEWKDLTADGLELVHDFDVDDMTHKDTLIKDV